MPAHSFIRFALSRRGQLEYLAGLATARGFSVRLAPCGCSVFNPGASEPWAANSDAAGVELLQAVLSK